MSLLHARHDAERAEAADVVRGDQLRVLDPVTHVARAIHRGCLLVGIEYHVHAAIADRVHTDLEAHAIREHDRVGELFLGHRG
jgi:hypothetical protein